MTATRGLVFGGLLLAALVAGTAADTTPSRPVRVFGGYQVLAADFHVHIFPFGWATLSPWDTVVEAGRQGLDVIAITPHEQVWAAKWSRWFSQRTGGPIVIVGEEITAPGYHMIAAGITEPVSSRLSATAAIEEIHKQGGVAIAAHPYGDTWLAYGEAGLRTLDGAEVVRPEAQLDEQMAVQLRGFFDRAPMTAIGSSDYHGIGLMGYSRTYVFARERTAESVVEAVREGRTVVHDRDRAYGDPALIQLARENGGLPSAAPTVPTPGAARLFSRIATLIALAAMLFFNRWSVLTRSESPASD